MIRTYRQSARKLKPLPYDQKAFKKLVFLILMMNGTNFSKVNFISLQSTKGSGNIGISDCLSEVSGGSYLKILSPKDMLQRLPIALARVRARNTSENLLNEILQTIYNLYRAKKMIKKYKTI